MRIKPPSALILRLIASNRPRNTGLSLPLVLVAALVLLLGGLALADRANQGLFGALFMNQSLEAREAAEIGMARIVGELNKPRNRGLLVMRNQADTGLWSAASISNASRCNTCITPKQLPTLANIDPDNGASTTSYGYWYIAEDGNISTTSTGAKRRFRLVGVDRTAVDDANVFSGASNFLLKIFEDRPQPDFRKVMLRVEGQSLRNGVITASATLEKQFELTPKCCDVPFGGAQGNVSYAGSGLQLCANNLGLGLLGGASGNNTGSITVNGKASTFTSGTIPVNPIYCLASNQAGCAIAINGNQSISVEVIPKTLNPAYTYANPSSPLPSGYDSTAKGPIPTTDAATSDATKFQYCTELNKGSCRGATIINADYSSGSLPSYCQLNTAGTEVHCNVTQLTYGNIFLKVGSRKLRLYFPSSSSNPVINQQGSGFLMACSSVSGGTPSSCTQPSSVTDVALFGCQNACPSQQTLQLGNGNAANSTLSIFAYFPGASVTLAGDSNFQGILWTDDVTSNGGVTWTIPGSGLADVFRLMGMDQDGGNNPILFDYVLRGTDYQRWLGG